MNKIFACLFGLILLLALGTSLSAKGATRKILISGVNLATPIEIVDATVVQRFQVWAGPGVFHGQAGVTTEETEGFIIDWPSGAVAERPRGLQHFQVSFYVTDKRFAIARPEELAYVVFYDYNPGSEHDYVYLPSAGDQWYEMNVRNISARSRGELVPCDRSVAGCRATAHRATREPLGRLRCRLLTLRIV